MGGNIDVLFWYELVEELILLLRDVILGPDSQPVKSWPTSWSGSAHYFSSLDCPIFFLVRASLVINRFISNY